MAQLWPMISAVVWPFLAITAWLMTLLWPRLEPLFRPFGAIVARTLVAVLDRLTAGLIQRFLQHFAHQRTAIQLLDVGGRNLALAEAFELDLALEILKTGSKPFLDLVFADEDGVVVVPKAIESEAIRRAWEKVHAENVVRDSIRNGLKAAEAFEKYGVL